MQQIKCPTPNTLLWFRTSSSLVSVSISLCTWGEGRANFRFTLTLKTVSVKEILAFLMALDATLGAAHTLASETPEKTFTLEAVSRRGGGPHDEIVRCCGRYRVDKRLQRLLIHVHFLWVEQTFQYVIKRHV